VRTRLLILAGLILIITGSIPTPQKVIGLYSPIEDYLKWRVPLPSPPLLSVLSKDGSTLVYSTVEQPNRLFVLDAINGVQLWNQSFYLNHLMTNITALTVSANGNYIAVSTIGGYLWLFERDTHNLIQDWEIGVELTYLGISEIGTFLVLTTQEFIIFLSRFETRFLWLRRLTYHPHYVNAIQLSKDGSYVAVLTTESLLQYIRTGDGQLIWTRNVDSSNFKMNPNGDILAIATSNSLQILEQRGQIIQEFFLFPRIFSMTSSGQYFVIAPNRTLHIFEQTSLVCQANFTLESDYPQFLSLIGNDNLLVIGTIFGDIYILTFPNIKRLAIIETYSMLLGIHGTSNSQIFIAMTDDQLFGFQPISQTASRFSSVAFVIISSAIGMLPLLSYYIFKSLFRQQTSKIKVSKH
jgi:WD40 repeat protein